MFEPLFRFPLLSWEWECPIITVRCHVYCQYIGLPTAL
jgi:hypothetical protein